MLGPGGTQLKAALDKGKGAGTPENLTPQPTAAGWAYETYGPSAAHEVVRANKLILSLLTLSCFCLFHSSQ